MSSISAIVTNHSKILTGLRDVRLHNKLAESKSKKWINMVQVLQDTTDMAITLRDPEVTLCQLLKLIKLHLTITVVLLILTGPPNHL